VKAAVYRRTGPAAEVLSVEDMPVPVPGPGEVLVRVRASGINPADVKRRAGWRGQPMDHPAVIPHADGAGEIVGLGAGVDPARLGQRVWLFNAQGGYAGPGRAFGTAAGFCALPSAQAIPLPDALSFEAGACLGIPAMTAHRAVFADGPVDGQTILVAGAGGAVAHLAVQFALAGGARVIGTSGALRADHARAAGCAEVVDRHAPDLRDRLAALAPDGFDRIVEVDFGANAALDIAVLKPNGVIASYSSTSVPEPVLPYYPLQFKGGTLRTVQGFNIPPEARAAGQAAIAELAARGVLRVAVGAALPLERIAEAHALVEAGRTIGNVVLTV
jgi:NADPH:quinone reductase